MAFTAAYPAFPAGEWPDWSPAIQMDGEYLQFWFRKMKSAQGRGHLEDILHETWLEFQYVLARLDSHM
jgi:hypothetical protein